MWGPGRTGSLHTRRGGPALPAGARTEFSMATYSAEDRLLFVEQKATKNELLLTSFSGFEAISQLFSFSLNFLSSDHAIMPDKLLGQPLSFGLAQSDLGKKQPFHGI